jgi:hypothetical protein
LWLVLEFAVFNAVFTGENGEACRGEGRQDGACWAMAKARFGQWIYGFYPFAERWRVNIVFLLGVLALVPMLIPSLPYKKLNAIFLLGIYPIITLILLTGGNFDITGSTWAHDLRVRCGHRAADPVPRLRGEDHLAGAGGHLGGCHCRYRGAVAVHCSLSISA